MFILVPHPLIACQVGQDIVIAILAPAFSSARTLTDAHSCGLEKNTEVLL